jgi:hypothetical protein
MDPEVSSPVTPVISGAEPLVVAFPELSVVFPLLVPDPLLVVGEDWTCAAAMSIEKTPS